MNDWLLRRRTAEVPSALGDLHPVLARVLAARGVRDLSALHFGLDAIHPPDRLTGLPAAVALLVAALRRQDHVMIVGDFDADGATSTALAMRVLPAMGFERVSYRVPDRFRYGYGLTPAIVESVAEQSPDLILTVDNGVSSVEGVEAARDRGIAVLVTDHHLPGPRLPAADAIVNPNLPGDDFPSKALAGVGVLFYLLVALRRRLEQEGWFRAGRRQPPNLAESLDLVALGTVADVVPLDHNNRILVEQGLRRIRAGRCRPGIRALLEVARRGLERTTASDLGFAVGPRINAAGRLDDMRLGIECLLAEDESVARRLAGELDALNRERREIESGMQTEAQALLQKLEARLDRQGLPPGLVLFEPHWHQGVVGILASRIKDRYFRPVVAFAEGEDGELKGSGRSVPGLHIRDALDAVAAAHPGLLSRFGGHAMAAGLSLPRTGLERFGQAFADEVARHLGGQPPAAEVWSDGSLLADQFDLELAQLLRQVTPWGQAFAEPCFDGRFECLNARIMAERHLKMTLRPLDGGPQLTALAFYWEDEGEGIPHAGQHLALVYRLDVNEYLGQRTLQLLVQRMRRL